MTVLSMYIGSMLIDQVELDYTYHITTADREKYQTEVAAWLMHKHRQKMLLISSEVEFFVEGVESKMKGIEI